MLMYFDAEPAALAKSDKANLTIRVSELMRAHRKGIHLVVLSRQTAQWLLAYIELSPHDRSTLAQISQELTQTGDLVRRTRHLIQISATSHTIKRLDDRVVELGIYCHNFDNVISHPVFVTEDSDDDIRLIDFILRGTSHSIVSGVSGIFRYVVQHGGGASTSRVALKQIDSGNIVVMSVDSDKHAPCAPDTKLDSLQRQCDSKGWPLFFFYQTPCRELENFIPIEIAARLQNCRISANFQLLLKHSVYEKNQKNHRQNECFWLWFDIKDGINRKKINSISNKEVLSWLSFKYNQMGLDLESVEMEGFGKNFVSECLKSEEICQELRESIKKKNFLEVFGDYFENFIWIFIAAPEKRT